MDNAIQATELREIPAEDAETTASIVYSAGVLKLISSNIDSSSAQEEYNWLVIQAGSANIQDSTFRGSLSNRQLLRVANKNAQVQQFTNWLQEAPQVTIS